jgi:Tetratricopeptide repeat
VLGRVLVLRGRFDEAVELAGPWPDGPSRNMVLAMAWHGLGRAEESEAALLALSEAPREMDHMRIAEVHAFRGEVDAAFRWLLGPVEGAPGGLQAVSRSGVSWMIPMSPFLKPLHTDPRWAAWHEASGRERVSRAVASAR